MQKKVEMQTNGSNVFYNIYNQIVSISDLEDFARNNTDYFNEGQEEICAGSDHNGEPIYYNKSYKYDSFAELPFNLQSSLIIDYNNR